MLIRSLPHPALGAAPVRLRRPLQDARPPGGFFKSLPAFELTLFAAIGIALALA